MKKILIVDDEIEMAKELKNILEMEDYEISHAVDGQEAIEKFSREDIGLVLLDIKMPKLGGLEAFRKMKEINSSIPVIVMTGSFARKSAIQAVKEGAVEAISKPFDVVNLMKLIKKYFKN